MPPSLLLALLAAGLLVGVAGSFAGLGGGVLVVPLLVFLGMPATRAVGTAFLSILIIAASSLAAHARLGHVNWRVGLLLGAGGVAGAQLGAPLLHAVPQRAFELVFAAALVGLALRLALGGGGRAGERAAGPPFVATRRARAAFLALGFVVGVAAAFTGLGGGFLIVPVGITLGMRVTEAVGTSALGIFVISGSALAAHAGLTDVALGAGAALGAGGVVGAQIGPRLVRRVSQRGFRAVFAALLGAVAVRMLL